MPLVNFWGREANMVHKDHKLSVRRQYTLLTPARSSPVLSAHGRKRREPAVQGGY